MHRFVMALLPFLVACAGHPGPSSESAAQQLYRDASAMTRADPAGAVAVLQSSLAAGYPSPSDVLVSAAWSPILDDPARRPQLFEILKDAARETSIAMASPATPGEPMVLTVRIVGARVEPPLVRAGVVVGIVHVDADGHYQPWKPELDWNPRHFGFAVTDESGTAVVRTVRPGYYASEYDAPDEPRHVHYNIEQDGRLLRASEFFFEDDPRLTAERRREAADAGIPIATVTRDESGVWRAEVTIPVRGLR
ncbi:MAG: hypothetical protein HKO59_07935 [Phycisphaerales bacterium]|nr:hypothetical protein [Phycisphaerales bacterium]